MLALLAFEAELTVTAAAVGRGLRRSHALVTALAVCGGALAFVGAVAFVWALWFVAPACFAGSQACSAGGASSAAAPYLVAGAAGQSAWLLAVAFAARRGLVGRSPARQPG